MRNHKIFFIGTIVFLLPLYGCIPYFFSYWYDVTRFFEFAKVKTPFVELCLQMLAVTWVQAVSAMALLAGAVVLQLRRTTRKAHIIGGIIVALYALGFSPLFLFIGYRIAVPHAAWLTLMPIFLSCIGIWMMYRQAVRKGVCLLFGIWTLLNLLICILNMILTQVAIAVSMTMFIMLIPSVLFIRNWMFPNSRVASCICVVIFAAGVWKIGSVFLPYMLLRQIDWLDLVFILTLPLSLICLIIDTVMVFRSRRKAAIPAVPGDPPAPAEE